MRQLLILVWCGAIFFCTFPLRADPLPDAAAIPAFVRQNCDVVQPASMKYFHQMEAPCPVPHIELLMREAVAGSCTMMRILAYRLWADHCHRISDLHGLAVWEERALLWLKQGEVGKEKFWLYLGYAEQYRNYSQYNNVQKGKEYYQLALNTARSYGMHKEEIEVLFRLSLFYEHLGPGNERNFGLAVQLAMQATDLAEKYHRDGRLKGVEALQAIQLPLLRLSESFYHSGHEAEAQRMIERFFVLNTPATGRPVINAWTMRGLLARRQARYSDAREAFQQALQVAQHDADTAWIGISLGNIGSVYLFEKNYAEALRYYEQNVQYSLRMNEWGDFVLGNIRIAKAYIGLQQHAKARVYVEKIPDYFLGDQTPYYVYQEYYETAAAFYAADRQYDKAFEAQEQLMVVKDTLLRRQTQDRLAELQTRFDLRQKESQIALLETENRLKDQSRQLDQIWLGIALLVAIGAVTTALFLFRLSRERKQRNRILHQQAEELEQANRTKDRLFSIIAHDLRSPLNSLQGILSLVTQYEMSREELQSVFRSLSQTIAGTTASLDNLLTWSRAQMQMSKTVPEATDLHLLIDGELQLLHSVARQKHIDLRMTVPVGLGAWVDPGQLRVICRNLIANALKFTPEGGQVCVEASPSGDQVLLSVRDTGQGMDEETMKRLFERQEVLSTRGTSGEKGTGLGLMLCREFLEANGSHLQVQSRVGEGTVFSFLLRKVPITR